MRLLVLIVCLLALSACQPPREGCGLLGCVTSPYLHARGTQLVGSDVITAINVMGGAPTSTYDVDDDTKALTWDRRQPTRSFGLLTCTETLMVRARMVISVAQRGNCGG